MTNREKKSIEKCNSTWIKGKVKTKNGINHPWKSRNNLRSY